MTTAKSRIANQRRIVSHLEGPHTVARGFVSFLLLAAICLSFVSIPNANSQSNVTSNTMTIKTPPAGQCSLLPLTFSAQAGARLSGEFTTDVIVNFYILSQDDFNVFVQSKACTLTAVLTHPLFSLEDVAGSHNQYSTTPTTNGIYYFVFVYRYNGSWQIASGYGTIRLSFPSFVTFTTLRSP